MHRTVIAAIATGCLAATGGPAIAGAGRLQPEWNLRLRHEQVHDDAFDAHASATTARLRAGVRAALAPSLTGHVDVELVGALDDGYNSGANGRSDLPAVADPQGVELNQAWLQWQGGGWRASGGRQRIAFDNHRWIGNVGWRQNEQTFDALSAAWTVAAGVDLQYAWLDRVHRVAGDDARDPLARERRLDSHLLHAGWTQGRSKASAYAYLHEDEDVATASTATIGARYAWAPAPAQPGPGVSLELARQSDHARNPRGFSHRYWLVEPILATRGATWRLGWEHLGGDGSTAVQAPLATPHAFNGWADRFLVTPASGLDDRYLAVNLPVGVAGRALEIAAAWHDYRADAAATGADDLGHELDVSVGMALRPGLRLLAKAADFRAGDSGRDARKLWVQLEWTPAPR